MPEVKAPEPKSKFLDLQYWFELYKNDPLRSFLFQGKFVHMLSTDDDYTTENEMKLARITPLQIERIMEQFGHKRLDE